MDEAGVSTEMSEDDGGHDWAIQGAGSPAGSESENEPTGPDAPSQPTQKRRRVTRACDECRRKKIKCDGKQPCTHCSVYSYGRLCDSSFSQLCMPINRVAVTD